MTIEFQDEPPAPLPSEGIPVWFCPRGEKHLLCLLEAPKWIGLHWLDGRSRPCEGPACPPVWHARPVNAKGYAPAMLYRRDLKGLALWQWTPVVAELSRQNGYELKGKECGSLLVFMARESRPGSQTVLRFYQPKAGLPGIEPPGAVAWDVVPVLLKLWGMVNAGPAKVAAESVLRFRRNA